MALLRQCLRELREQRQEWDVPDDHWPETKSQSEDALAALRFDLHQPLRPWPSDGPIDRSLHN
jgi:hypothetical protein